MVALVPISGERDFAIALGMLGQGFPERSEEYWRRGWRRAEESLPSTGFPLGTLMVIKGKPEGVALTFASRRTGTDRITVNLSSWYVADGARFFAPMMLKRLTGADALYTDLTPIPSVVKISKAIGFEVTADALALVALPLHAILPSGPVITRDEGAAVRAGAPDGVLQILADHARLGFIGLALEGPQGWSPLVMRRRRRRGLTLAEVIYADRDALNGALPSVARHLLRRGIGVLGVDQLGNSRLPAFALRIAHQPRLAMGGPRAGVVDYAYSEFAFF